jgi:hypothetical protein
MPVSRFPVQRIIVAKIRGIESLCPAQESWGPREAYLMQL